MKNKKSVIISIIFIVTTIVLGAYIIHDKVFKEKEQKETIITIDDKNININEIFQINDILNSFDKAFNDSTTKFYGYPYKNKLYMKNFNLEAAIYVSICNEMEKSNNVQTIRESKIISNFNKIFGNNLKYERTKIELGEGYKFEYGATPYLAYIAPFKKNDLYAPEYIATTTKINFQDDKVLVTRKLVYVMYEQDENSNEPKNAILYTGPKKEKMLGRIKLKNGEINMEQLIGSYGSKLDTYIYTFNYEKSKYILYKINKK